jgi:hypothetical protein
MGSKFPLGVRVLIHRVVRLYQKLRRPKSPDSNTLSNDINYLAYIRDEEAGAFVGLPKGTWLAYLDGEKFLTVSGPREYFFHVLGEKKRELNKPQGAFCMQLHMEDKTIDIPTFQLIQNDE